MTHSGSTAKTRIRFIDTARGIAIICIILGHLGSASINRVVYTFHIPLFFLITGYFISTKASFSRFAKKKFRSLILPYLLTSAVIVLLAAVKGLLTDGNLTAPLKAWTFAALYGSGNNYQGLIQIKGIGAIWFLWASFIAVLIMRLLLKADYRIRILGVITAFNLGYLTSLYCWMPFSLQPALCSVIFIYLGYAYRGMESTLKKLNRELIAVLLILALLIWVTFITGFRSFWIVDCDFGRGIIDMIGCICACAVVFAVSYFTDRFISPVSAVLSFLGENSLFILCVHTVEQNLMPWSSILNLILPGAASLPRLLVLIALKLTLDTGLGCLLSRIPVVRKAFGV
ncbi:acyltransferase family protein [Butyrivibrio sp. AE2032]|uniref:acyltransferase family protein n=1 Tax=Butyrivibrio sp. AE2032 TaxID=1458463 RepID=UPI00054E2F31|nr:acyltransferase family protein [Butyrivibrio sp. AE2032]